MTNSNSSTTSVKLQTLPNGEISIEIEADSPDRAISILDKTIYLLRDREFKTTLDVESKKETDR